MKVNICDIPRGKEISDYPDDTVFVFSESFPRYILDPFETIYPDDPRYESALTYEEALKMID